VAELTVENVPNSATPEITIQQTTNGVEIPIDASEGDSSTTVVTVRTVPIPKRLDALMALVKEKTRSGLDESLQKELAELLKLIPELVNPQHERLVPLAEIAVVALLSETSNNTLAKEIRENIERHIRPSPIQGIWKDPSPPTRVIMGLGTLLYFVIPLLVFFSLSLPGDLTQREILGMESSQLLLVAIAGAVGSVVSIMVRIQDFMHLKNPDSSVLFFTGFFKPIVGTSFALFVFAVLSSGLIPVTIDPLKATYFFAALAFVSGFSERFAKDVATRTEQTVVAIQSSNL
jgi:hypothetical protein